jgi:hypothetical protein
MHICREIGDKGVPPIILAGEGEIIWLLAIFHAYCSHAILQQSDAAFEHEITPALAAAEF